MKRKYFLILAMTVLLIGFLAGCGNEADKLDETVTQESLYEEETKENDVQQDKTANEMPDWLAAYMDYVEGITHFYVRGFFYIDGDDIPEFIIGSGIYGIVLTYHDGEVDVLQTDGSRIRYIEKKNLLCVTSGQAGEYADQVYSIENGRWTYMAGGKYISEFKDGLYVDKFSFEWEGETIEEERYWESFHHVFDEKQAIIPKGYIGWNDMMSHIEAGDFAWVLTAEPHTHTYSRNAEIIEDFEYSDEYIPISKVDFASYKNEMSEEDWQALSSFFPILLEGKTFMADIEPSANEYTDDFEEHSINDLLYARGFDEYPDEFVLDRFALCDLTGDGQKELVVYTNFSIGLYCVFHKEGDNFYAVYMDVRWFENLQKNGIYIGSGGAGTSYFKRLHFLRDVFWGEEIAMYDWGYCRIGGEEVSEAEMEAWENEMMVGGVVWYEARADWELSPNRQRLAAYEMPDWLVAYVDYAKKLEAEEYTTRQVTYSIIYVDADDIPELVIEPCLAWSHILTFHDGEIDELITDRTSICYMERKNLLNNCSGVMGFYHDYIYSIENGKWVYVTGGEYYERRDEINKCYYFDYVWEDEEVTEDVYKEKLKEVFDVEHAIDSENFESLEDILSSLQM